LRHNGDNLTTDYIRSRAFLHARARRTAPRQLGIEVPLICGAMYPWAEEIVHRLAAAAASM